MRTLFRPVPTAVRQVTLPPPPAVMLYLDDFCGGCCRRVVRTGDRVLLGQAVGLPEDCGAAVHASVSGTVRAVGSGAVVIENDCRDAPAGGMEPLVTLEDPPPDLTDRLNGSGILTAEGTPLRLVPDRPCRLLALCLLPEDGEDLPPLAVIPPETVFGGLRAMISLLRPRRTVVVWDRRLPAYGRLAGRYGIPAESMAVDFRRPQLGLRLIGRTPEPGLTLGDLGCVLLDAQGAAAVWGALYLGQPFLRRRVTVAGPGRETVCVTAPLGTAVRQILAAAGFDPPGVLLGGPKGRLLRELQTPIGKTDGRITCLAER